MLTKVSKMMVTKWYHFIAVKGFFYDFKNIYQIYILIVINSKRFFDNLSRLYAIYVTLLNGLRMKDKYMKMTKIWKLQSLIDFYLLWIQLF